MQATRRLATGLAASLVVAIPLGPAHGQRDEPTIARTMVSDLAVEVRLTDDSRLRVGAGDGDHAITLTVMPKDARRWVDAVTRLAALRRRKALPDTQWSVALEEPGIEAGALTVTRRWRSGESSWSLLLASKDFEQIRRPLELDEVRALAAAVRRGGDELAPPEAKPRKKRQRRPAAPKPPASASRSLSRIWRASAFSGSNGNPASSSRNAPFASRCCS